MVRRLLPTPLLAVLLACSSSAGKDSSTVDDTAAPGDSGGSDSNDDSGGAESAGEEDPEALFPKDRVVEVVVTLADADWAALRAESASWFDRFDGEACLDAPYVYEFGEYVGDVSLLGTTLHDVVVHKKGGWMDEDPTRPSLKLDLDQESSGRTFAGLDTLTLENQRLDPSGIRLCAVYAALSALGQPAPRCALAHVVVNGEDLGIYAHVEDADDVMIPRRYGEQYGDEIDVYEGGDADFLEGWTGGFEPTNSATDVALGPILALTTALIADDATVVDAVASVADVDALAATWAAEVLFEHTAGYAAARGATFVVHPDDGLTHLVLWDPVVSLGAAPPAAGPLGLLAGAVPWRLAVADPARLTGALGDVLGAWDEAAMAEDVSRLAGLARAATTVDSATFESSVTTIQDFVSGRRVVLGDALVAGLPVGDPPSAASPCLIADGGITITFETTWGSESESSQTYGACSILTAAGEDVGGATAGNAADGVGAVYSLGWRQGADFGEAEFSLPSAPTAPVTLPIDGRNNVGYERVRASDGDRYWVLMNGELYLTEQGTTQGATVSAAFAGVRYRADFWSPF